MNFGLVLERRPGRSGSPMPQVGARLLPDLHGTMTARPDAA